MLVGLLVTILLFLAAPSHATEPSPSPTPVITMVSQVVTISPSIDSANWNSVCSSCDVSDATLKKNYEYSYFYAVGVPNHPGNSAQTGNTWSDFAIDATLGARRGTTDTIMFTLTMTDIYDTTPFTAGSDAQALLPERTFPLLSLAPRAHCQV